MDLKQFSNSKFLAKSDVPTPRVLTIASFGIEKMQDNSNKPWVAWLESGVKPMLLNKVNRNRLEVICGSSQTEAMIGKRVEVFNDPMIEMQGQIVGGLRIRPVSVSTLSPDVEQALALAKARADAVTKAVSGEPNDDIPF